MVECGWRQMQPAHRMLLLLCVSEENRFLIFYDFSVPLWILIFFFVLLHSHSLCVLALVEGGWLKGCFWNRLKSRKISFGSPLFLFRKQLRSCMSTTRRLANTLIPQQQLDCNFCSRVCWRRRISPFYSSNQDELQQVQFYSIKIFIFSHCSKIFDGVPVWIIDRGIRNFMAGVVKWWTHVFVSCSEKHQSEYVAAV